MDSSSAARIERRQRALHMPQSHGVLIYLSSRERDEHVTAASPGTSLHFIAADTVMPMLLFSGAAYVRAGGIITDRFSAVGLRCGVCLRVSG